LDVIDVADSSFDYDDCCKRRQNSAPMV